ncbi:BrnA antitoxin family protein [Rhizobium sp. CSW-27]|uniref:BrnA antitoxin family protein n=1 Tax=Rhizobium sp. CSW-27 TaxID=2839985 RepID=UPI001C039755|nr:BrnA antitoxin family protein [Rhizobium sp. CSW-27]MBT9370492.1 BrnA antitoxin family protein [Rhizobium sp. CSW-27]
MSISPNRLRALAERSDEAIDYSDIPPLDDRFFEAAELVQPAGKAQITMRIDSDVLDWFRAQGKGYQTRMNAVLKTYMLTQSKR